MAATLYASQVAAIAAAENISNRNGAPVAVIFRDAWFQVIEDADEYERLCDEGAESVAVIDPDNGDRS